MVFNPSSHAIKGFQLRTITPAMVKYFRLYPTDGHTFQYQAYMTLTLNLPFAKFLNPYALLTIRVYSVDGRLVTRSDTEDIQADRISFLLNR